MKNEKHLYIIVAIASVVGVGILFLMSHQKPASAPTVSYKQVDELRKETQIRKTMESKKVAVDNYRSAPSLSNAYRQVEDDTNVHQAIKLESEKHAVVGDQDDSGHRQPINFLESQINKRLVNDQKAAELSDIQKKQFIQNYKKQALAKGYEVELNDQLVITKVTKVVRKGPASIPTEDVEMQEYDEDESGE